MDREVDNNNTSQGSGLIKTSRKNERETHDNGEDPNLRSSACNRKPPTPHEPYFDGKQYGAQPIGVKIGNKMTNTRSLNSISMNAFFMQVLQTESAPEAPVVHKQI